MVFKDGVVDAVRVRVEDLTVVLPREHHKPRSIKEVLIGRERRSETFTVLDSVSFSLTSGATMGVIGRNGAGKTTLLRAIAGIIPPTHGRVVTREPVAPLIELGAGFDPELDATENVFLYGSLLGMSRRWLKSSCDAVFEFAGLGEARRVPLRNFSTGMIARLGFAVATVCRPHVLLVDEVLAVGDAEFRERCLGRIAELRREGTAVVLVSHDLELVRQQADFAIALDKGRVMAEGAPGEVVASYLTMGSKGQHGVRGQGLG